MYTPAANYNGTDSFTYRASDGSASSNLATVTLTIDAVNDAPVADADAYSVNEDGSLSIPAATGVLDGDTDVEGSTLTAVLVGDVPARDAGARHERVVHVHPGRQLQRDRLVHLPGGDGSTTSNLATVTLTVNPVNDVPVADDDAYTTSEDVPITASAGTGVLLGDTDVDGDTLSATLVGDVQHGTLILNANGSFATPRPRTTTGPTRSPTGPATGQRRRTSRP